jgi:16S rRNA (adenine1518-N6/adenine1519-N6)-dimethyltransferase
MTKHTAMGHRARKRFGQNFLHDVSVIERIVQAVAPRKGQHLVEIGPGQGALTGHLVDSGCTLDVIELDRDLVPGLLASYGLKDNFTLHSADALAFDFAQIASAGNPLRIVPGSKAWGRLGIMAQYHCRVDKLFEVPPEAFSPRPKVQSAIVRLAPWQDKPWPDVDPNALRKLVQAAFAQRRKTLRNNLKGLMDSETLESLGLDPSARAETLQLVDFITIANALGDGNEQE